MPKNPMFSFSPALKTLYLYSRCLEANGSRSSERTLNGIGYRVYPYRPESEGLFARIERWLNLQTGESHWRSISRENITTLYGDTAESRIAHPSDPTHIFKWCICESYDDKGNAILYGYKAERIRTA